MSFILFSLLLIGTSCSVFSSVGFAVTLFGSMRYTVTGAELEPSPFRIVIDAGSTGSRLHIFEFINNEEGNVECIRRGSSKAWVKLSVFANDNKEKPLNATHVAHHMLPLFDYASIIIPLKYHSSTPVRIAATAGMRLLSIKDQARVYDALYTGLLEQVDIGRFTFTALRREDIMTLDGDREAFFGAVSANYLKGVVDAQLRVIVSDELDDNDQGLCTNKFGMCEEHAENINLRIPNKKHNEAIPLDDRGICTNKFGMCEQDAEDIVFGSYISQNSKHDVKKHGVLGALDMGGSSTQIVYRHTTDRSNRRDETIVANESSEDELMKDVPSHLKDEEFFSISYLSYGVDQFRVRLWDLWISEAQEKDSIDDDPIILNPCSFVGYQMIYKNCTLLGTGDSILCSKEVNRLIPHHDNVIDLDELYDDNIESIKEQEEANDKMVGGIKHPPIKGKYLAMSLYFFTLDCLRELSDNDHPINVHWPTPTIDELKHALESFCARSWKDDLEEVQHEAHEYTMADILPHRCLEAVYLVTLLKDGFGFHPSKRDITFTHKVDGNEVEWSLGLALSEYAAEKEE